MTYTQICNLALGSLGHDRVVDDYDGKTGGVYNDLSTEAVRCRLFLPVAIEETLGAHDWNWAAREIPVSLSSPSDGAWCRLDRPTDALRVVGVFLRGAKLEKIETRMADGFIWARAVRDRKAFLRYVPNDISEDEWPWWFRDALVHALAAKLAGPMFGDDAKTQGLVALAQRRLSSAILSDDGETSRTGSYVNPLLAARA